MNVCKQGVRESEQRTHTRGMIIRGMIILRVLNCFIVGRQWRGGHEGVGRGDAGRDATLLETKVDTPDEIFRTA